MSREPEPAKPNDAKRCPFCNGSTIRAHQLGLGSYTASCLTCGASGPSATQAHFVTNDEAGRRAALAAWNRRIA